ncbi:MAG: trypsin-like peptidase domain-containing protein [Anaeroplasmataceae bacterium]|nr:trypsin-like peptidase domain-containing protein [Anaeroplasmataceae bacterium]
MGLGFVYNPLEAGSVEDTVDQIYDSVVAIDAYMNNQHYGSGSGVLFGYDERFSYIATCHHVIEGCQGFKIILSNDEAIEAKLVGGDSESDIAVLSVEKTDLTYASWFEDTEKLRLGSSVICIGNPLGTLPGSVSTGVVSYNNRLIQVDSYHTMKLIQTDVAINSGNSGGGLFNSAGALIGIVNAKYSSSGIEGLGFAIPANQARTIIDNILKTAKYNASENMWETGYVEGRWEIGFTLGYGGYGFIRTTIGIASPATNPTHSDYNKLQANDMLNAITITYKDASKEIKSLTNITAQTMTVDTIYQFIYSAGLSLGDVITFDITRGNLNMTIEVPLVQYRYSI